MHPTLMSIGSSQSTRIPLIHLSGRAKQTVKMKKGKETRSDANWKTRKTREGLDWKHLILINSIQSDVWSGSFTGFNFIWFNINCWLLARSINRAVRINLGPLPALPIHQDWSAQYTRSIYLCRVAVEMLNDSRWPLADSSPHTSPPLPLPPIRDPSGFFPITWNGSEWPTHRETSRFIGREEKGRKGGSVGGSRRRRRRRRRGWGDVLLDGGPSRRPRHVMSWWRARHHLSRRICPIYMNALPSLFSLSLVGYLYYTLGVSIVWCIADAFNAR